jgi:quercetin dioxygenase-like cupin family protein
MAHAGQEIEGYDGFKLLLVRVDDDVLEMEATYSGEAGMPPAHRHPRQVEHFEVLEGAMNTVIGGVERRYEPGETFEVATDVMHSMGADGPTRTRWEIRPALRTAEFFERLHGTGPDSAREAENIVEFLAEFGEEIQFTEEEAG